MDATEMMVGLLESLVQRFCAENRPSPGVVEALAAKYGDRRPDTDGLVAAIEEGQGELTPEEVQERCEALAQESAQSVAEVMREEEDWAEKLAREAVRIAHEDSGTLPEKPTESELLQREARILEMFVDEVLTD